MDENREDNDGVQDENVGMQEESANEAPKSLIGKAKNATKNPRNALKKGLNSVLKAAMGDKSLSSHMIRICLISVIVFMFIIIIMNIIADTILDYTDDTVNDFLSDNLGDDSSLSEEAKKRLEESKSLYEKKGSLIKFSVQDINKLHDNYMKNSNKIAKDIANVTQGLKTVIGSKELTSGSGGSSSVSMMTEEEINKFLGNIDYNKLSEGRRAVLSVALSALGKIPYYWGGTSSYKGFEGNNFGTPYPADSNGRALKGLDCSHFVDWVCWTAIDNNLNQGYTGVIWELTEEIGKNELKPGDFAFKGAYPADHIGIYAGNGKWIHCNASDNNVSLNDVSYWTSYRRLPSMDTAKSILSTDSSIASKYKSYVFVGDSRTNGLSKTVGSDKGTFICKDSQGYQWFNSTALNELKGVLDKKPLQNVILNLGVNDYDNIDKYISAYTSLFKSYPSTNFVIMSVNPIEDAKASSSGYLAKDASVVDFNNKMKAAFSSRYLDCYSYLVKKGFSTVDGIHYTNETYNDIYKYIIDSATSTTSSNLKSSIQNVISNAPGTVSVAVKNLDKGELVTINSNKTVSASMIKVFIMATVYQQISDGKLKETNEIKSLLNNMITVSDNSATNSLVEKIGSGDFDKGKSIVNKYCITSGYPSTQLVRKLGISNPTSENYTSVNDCVAILEKIYRNKCVSSKYSTKMKELLNKQTVKNKIPAGIPNDVTIGNKTGELDSADNDMAIVYNSGSNKTNYVICIMITNMTGGFGSGVAKVKEISQTVYNVLNE